jgi:hemerythrin
MDELIFTEDLITGVESVDLQHKSLINCINELNHAYKDNKKTDKTTEMALEQLIQYTIKHFQDEELILKKNGYVSLDFHKKQHQEFTDKILQYKERHKKGEQIIYEVINFLSKWLVNHIKREDQLALKKR